MTTPAQQEAQWLADFEAEQLAIRIAEGWSEKDARRHYLAVRKDGYHQDITTYHRWEGYLARARHELAGRQASDAEIAKLENDCIDQQAKHLAAIDRIAELEATKGSGEVVALPSAAEWLDGNNGVASPDWRMGWDAARNRLAMDRLTNVSPAQPVGCREIPLTETDKAALTVDREHVFHQPVAKLLCSECGQFADYSTLLCEGCLEKSAQPVAGEKVDEVYAYAIGLACTLWTRHYHFDAPHWAPLPDTLGVLTQVDSMVSGLAKPQQSAALPEGYSLVSNACLSYLHGSGELDGKWFERPESAGAFWWRSILRENTLVAPQPTAQAKGD